MAVEALSEVLERPPKAFFAEGVSSALGVPNVGPARPTPQQRLFYEVLQRVPLGEARVPWPRPRPSFRPQSRALCDFSPGWLRGCWDLAPCSGRVAGSKQVWHLFLHFCLGAVRVQWAVVPPYAVGLWALDSFRP